MQVKIKNYLITISEGDIKQSKNKKIKITKYLGIVYSCAHATHDFSKGLVSFGFLHKSLVDPFSYSCFVNYYVLHFFSKIY